MGKIPSPALPLPPRCGPGHAHLGRESMAANRVLRAGATRRPPVQMQLQGPVLPPGAQGHLRPGRQSELHCEGRAGEPEGAGSARA